MICKRPGAAGLDGFELLLVFRWITLRCVGGGVLCGLGVLKQKTKPIKIQLSHTVWCVIIATFKRTYLHVQQAMSGSSIRLAIVVALFLQRPHSMPQLVTMHYHVVTTIPYRPDHHRVPVGHASVATLCNRS